MQPFLFSYPIRQVLYFLCLALGSWLAIACKGNKQNNKGNAVARVGERYLYANDLEGIGRGLSPEDSSYQAKMYIEKWILDELVLGVAQNNLSGATSSKIEQLVQEYRASLVIDFYEQKLIASKLDSIVTAAQLAEYYTKHKEDYISGFSWVRCYFVKAERSLEGIDNLRNWFKSGNEDDIDKVINFATQKQTIHILDNNTWIRYDKLTNQLPDKSLDASYLQSNRVYDRTDDKFLYLLKVFEYKDKDAPAPLSQVQDEISRIILQQRRSAILDEFRQSSYQKAKEKGFFDIY